ncbi:MAG: hypothetical protein VW239_07345 [Candidatus Nanopelagicales bacterium]
MGDQLIIWDANYRDFLGTTWRAYALTFPDSFGVFSWDEAARVLEDMPGMHVQVWGHGRTAQPLIDLKKPPLYFPWHHCRSAWFRSCSVANGDKGRAFMADVAKECDVAAHLGIVGTWAVQSRLVGVRKGEAPWWGDTDPREHSAPWVPRSVPVTARRLPAWTWAP